VTRGSRLLLGLQLPLVAFTCSPVLRDVAVGDGVAGLPFGNGRGSPAEVRPGILAMVGC